MNTEKWIYLCGPHYIKRGASQYPHAASQLYSRLVLPRTLNKWNITCVPIMHLRFIHVCSVSVICSQMVTHCMKISKTHLSLHLLGYFGYFYFGTVMKGAFVNIHISIFLWVYVLISPWQGLLVCRVVYVLLCEKEQNIFPKYSWHFIFSQATMWDFWLLCIRGNI